MPFKFLPFYLFNWGHSEVQLQVSRRLILPLQLGVRSEVQNKVSRRLILPLYLITFSPGEALRSRFRFQDGSFYLFTFLNFHEGCSEVQIQTSRWLILPFYLFPFYLGVGYAGCWPSWLLLAAFYFEN